MIEVFEDKPTSRLLPTGILQQTSYWSRVKSRLGWAPKAYEFVIGSDRGDILVILRRVAADVTIAYVPYGPEMFPEVGEGAFLEALSECLRRSLPDSCILIRWDLPWESPYAGEDGRFDGEGNWLGPPEPHLREIRMNFGTVLRNLRKSASDILPADTIFVNLDRTEEDLFSGMKPKTRYNIRLAERRGVRVREGSIGDLGIWMDLYSETAARNGIVSHGEDYFSVMFAPGEASARLLIAESEGRPAAAMFLAISGNNALYLYGASSSARRHLMAPYALQWAAMKKAREQGCREYDLFGVAPRPDPSHPLYGLLRFKTGFGGTMFHRRGCWDYPLDRNRYESFRIREMTDSGFHIT